MKDKKTRQLGIWLENEQAAAIKKLSGQAKLSKGEIVRLCVDRQLEDPDYLKKFTWKKKPTQFNMLFDDSQIRKMNSIARHTGLSLAEIVRLCVASQLDHIRREGGFKLKFNLEGK